MAKKVDPDAIWKFEGAAYTAIGVPQINDVQLLDLHNKLARYLGNEERSSYPSRKLLESSTISMLVQANAPGVAKAPKGEKPIPKKGKAAKSDIPSDSGTEDEKESTMNTKAKTAAKGKAKATKSSDRRKSEPSKERQARVTFEGKKLNAKVKDNPRREGTSRHKSLGIVIANKGITYEQYIKKGGEHGDLAANIRKGYVTAS